MSYNHNFDDYAWYEVGEQRYYNKIEALLAQQSTNQPIKWNVTDSDYAQHKWDVEPLESLDELYAQRAQHIRNRYDYLVLHFSGGSDSANILETFIRNKIHLDEVIIRGSISQSSEKSGVLTATDIYAECKSQAFPLAKWVKENHMPHLRITVVDTVDMINAYYKNNANWVELGVTGFTPSGHMKNNFDTLAPHYAQLAEQGKKIAHVVGIDKPRIFRHKNYFYTRYADSYLGEYWASTGHKITPYPQYFELFYWGKNAIKLQIKQLHLLKQHIKKYSIPDHVFNHSLTRPYENFIASIIYNRTLPLLAESGKKKSNSIITSRDHWFSKDTHRDSYVNWHKGADYIKTLIKPRWFDNNGFWEGGLQGIWSKPYYLGT